jgi:hypothetical protein
MHYDEEHDVQIKQMHRAYVEQVDKYALDSDDYMTFLQITDQGEQEEFILQHGRHIEGSMEVDDLAETISVDVEDLGG